VPRLRIGNETPVLSTRQRFLLQRVLLVGVPVMHFPIVFVCLQDFTLTESRPPHLRDGHVVGLRWGYVDVERGDLVKFSPAGMMFTIFRLGKIVGQERVTDLARRSFLTVGWITPVP
jgi:hypothetical protein